MNKEARKQIAEDSERDEAKARDKAHSILAEARKLCVSRQVTNQRLYFLSAMTGHSFYEIKAWALTKGLEVWWNIYRKNPKYARWYKDMDSFDANPRWPL